MGSKFRWNKKGLVFAPDEAYEWMQSHAQKPSALVLEDRLRVYFTCRPKRDPDGNFTSVTAVVDLKKDDPTKIIRVHDEPVLSPGGIGTFDQFGAMPGCALLIGNEVWLYYAGWIRCRGVPYHNSIGLAVSEDGGTRFRRFGKGPIIGRTPEEPFLQGSPFVLRHEDMFYMWYCSGVEWIEHDGRAESIYVLMHAKSGDGIRWEREGVPCIPSKVEHECQASPSVIEIDGRFHMWFSYRHGLDFRNAERGYKIGYAWSDDLMNWHRNDGLGALTPSKGWDSQMVCYPHVIEVDGNTYMFYSGNHFGRDGFGYAVLDESNS